MNWLKAQYDDIKGNVKWALLGGLWLGLIWIVKHLLQLIPHFPIWLDYSILLLSSAGLFVYLGKQNRIVSGQLAIQPTTAPLSPANKAFDATQFFKLAYYSQLQPEIEFNIRAAATQNQPNNREDFYVKLIGVGLVGFMYDTIWYTIYGSQLLALLELNRRGGILAIATIKSYYDKAVTAFPAEYSGISFDSWSSFMITNTLNVRHPSDMVEITIRGKDFLKYLLHYGRDADQRRL